MTKARLWTTAVVASLIAGAVHAQETPLRIVLPAEPADIDACNSTVSNVLTAPVYFNHVRYGLYYHDLIIEESQKHDIDPLFMFSVIRQESLFEGFVKSTAGAHGLMQVIPDTGTQIAGELKWPQGFDQTDLYRPIVSVRFGAYYLDKNRDTMNGSIYGSLAAYNAGPGNALVWKGLAGDDPDLLLEIIRFQETRDYIRFIYEIYSVYRNLIWSRHLVF